MKTLDRAIVIVSENREKHKMVIQGLMVSELKIAEASANVYYYKALKALGIQVSSTRGRKKKIEKPKVRISAIQVDRPFKSVAENFIKYRNRLREIELFDEASSLTDELQFDTMYSPYIDPSEEARELIRINMD